MIKAIIAIIIVVLLGAGAYIYSIKPKTGTPPSSQSKKSTEQKSSTKEVKTAKKIEITEKDLIKLSQETMRSFALSLKQKDMTTFHNDISDTWKANTSVEKLNKIFDPIIKSGVDLTVLDKIQPTIEKNTGFTKEKDLHIEGHYNTSDAIVHFNETYRLDKNGEWKLIAYFLDIKGKK